MWDKPAELNNLSSVLLGITALLLLIGALHYALHRPQFKLRAVVLAHAPQQLDVAQVKVALDSELLGNFFTVDLEHTRRTFEKLPWVRKVSVRRHFPWKLEVEIEEHTTLARWNDSEWVNTHGEIFAVDKGPVAASLPAFFGHPDSAAEVTQMYRAFTEQLSPLQQTIVQIHLSPRRAWQLRFKNGLLVKLGRDQAQQRLARLVSVYPWAGIGNQESGIRNAVQYVDLRYRNGFAVKYQAAGSGEM